MDSSFILDVNNNSIDVPTSTPKKKRKIELKCSSCDKEYVSKFYYDKHVSSCVGNSSINANITNSTNFSLNVSDISLSALNHHAVKPVPKKTSTFKVPAIPKPKVKPTYTCTYCLKGYVCQKSYKNHQMTHSIQDAASRYPNKDKVMESIQELTTRVMTAVLRAPSSGEVGAEYRKLCDHLMSMSNSREFKDFSSAVCEEVLNCVVGQKFLLPSALLSALVSQVEQILDDRRMCAILLDTLEITDLFSKEILDLFFLEFILNFTKELLVFISRCVRGSDQSARKQQDVPEIDSEDRQVIYYIGGSIIRGYIRLAHRYSTNDKWATLGKVLSGSVLSDDPSKEQDAAWTASLNRGGLLFISSKFQEFLIELTKVVYCYQKKDGFIDINEVIEVVCNGSMCITWDSMISNVLSEQVSLSLMIDIVKLFCNTCGRAFAIQKLNILRHRPVVSMNIRHVAASRKKR